MKVRVLLCAGVIACSHGAQAANWDAHALYARLSSDNDAVRAMGVSYVLGVIDGGGDGFYCSPRAQSGAQIADAVLRHMKAYRVYGSEDAALVVAVALVMKWPCPEGTKPKKTAP